MGCAGSAPTTTMAPMTTTTTAAPSTSQPQCLPTTPRSYAPVLRMNHMNMNMDDETCKPDILASGDFIQADGTISLFGHNYDKECIINTEETLVYRNCSDIPRWKSNYWQYDSTSGQIKR